MFLILLDQALFIKPAPQLIHLFCLILSEVLYQKNLWNQLQIKRPLMALFLEEKKGGEGGFAQIILLFILPLLFTNHGFVLFSMFSSPALHNETLHWKVRGIHRLV